MKDRGGGGGRGEQRGSGGSRSIVSLRVWHFVGTFVCGLTSPKAESLTRFAVPLGPIHYPSLPRPSSLVTFHPLNKEELH